MPYWPLYYHVTWSTHRRQPIVYGEAADIIEAVIRNKLKELDCIHHGIKVMPDHVHVAISIPPSRAVSDVVKDIKGVSSYLVKRRLPELRNAEFRWQSEYGVLSFGEKALPDVAGYIRDQERRHRQGTTWSRLEHVGDEKE